MGIAGMGSIYVADWLDGGDCFLEMGDVGIRVMDLLPAIYLGADVSGD